MGKRTLRGRRVRHGVALVVGSLLIAAPMVVKAAPRGAECQLSGTATLNPGLTTAKRAQTVTFSTINLTKCLVGNSGAPGVPKFQTASAIISPNPATSAPASCAQSALKGLSATIFWPDGTNTTVTFNTTSVTGATAINGKVSGGTNSYLKPGDLVAGAAVFKPAQTSMNCVKPVTAVTFSGAIGAGSPK